MNGIRYHLFYTWNRNRRKFQNDGIISTTKIVLVKSLTENPTPHATQLVVVGRGEQQKEMVTPSKWNNGSFPQ